MNASWLSVSFFEVHMSLSVSLSCIHFKTFVQIEEPITVALVQIHAD